MKGRLDLRHIINPIEKKGVKPSACTTCGKVMDAATPMSGGDTVRPQEGDFTICVYCGEILRFDAEGALRASTEAELRELDARQVRAIKHTQRLIRTKRQ